MSVIWTSRTRAWRLETQPRSIGRINVNNSITNRLVFAAYPLNNTYWDAVTQSYGTPVGAITEVGMRRRGGGANVDFAMTAVSDTTSTTEVIWPVSMTRGATMANTASVLCLGGVPAQVDNDIYTMASCADPDSSGHGYGLAIDSFNQVGRGNIIKTSYIVRGVSPGTTGFLGNPFANKLHFFGYSTWDNGATGLWLHNRKSAAFSGVATNGTTLTNKRARILRISSTLPNKGELVALVLFWDRNISEGEYQELYDCPWLVFERPTNRLYFGATVAPPGGFQAAWASQRSRMISSGMGVH